MATGPLCYLGLTKDLRYLGDFGDLGEVRYQRALTDLGIFEDPGDLGEIEKYKYLGIFHTRETKETCAA